MESYIKKQIWGKSAPGIWGSLVMSTLILGFTLIVFINLLKRLDEDNEGFEILIPFFFLIVLGWMLFSFNSIMNTNKNHVIFTKDQIIHNDGKSVRKILFKKIKVLRSEPMADIYDGFISLLYAGHYQIYLNDGKTEIFIKDMNFSNLDIECIFAWLAGYSKEYDFRVQDHAGYLKEINKSEFTKFKSTRLDSQNMSLKKERQSIAVCVFVVIVLIVAMIMGITFERGVIVRIKELSYPEQSTTSMINIDITLENRGDHTGRAKDIQVRIIGVGIEEIIFTWYENIGPQETSHTSRQVNVKYDPFPGSTTSYYSIGVTLFYKGEEVDWES